MAADHISVVPSLCAKNAKGFLPGCCFSAHYVLIENAEIAIPQNYKAVAGNAGPASQADVEELAGIRRFCEGGDGENKNAAS